MSETWFQWSTNCCSLYSPFFCFVNTLETGNAGDFWWVRQKESEPEKWDIFPIQPRSSEPKIEKNQRDILWISINNFNVYDFFPSRIVHFRHPWILGFLRFTQLEFEVWVGEKAFRAQVWSGSGGLTLRDLEDHSTVELSTMYNMYNIYIYIYIHVRVYTRVDQIKESHSGHSEVNLEVF